MNKLQRKKFRRTQMLIAALFKTVPKWETNFHKLMDKENMVYTVRVHRGIMVLLKKWPIVVTWQTRWSHGAHNALVTLARKGFDSKHDFAPPTILLGLLCPWTWGISSQPLQHLLSCWGFSDLGHGVSVCVWVSPVEVQVSSGLLQGQGSGCSRLGYGISPLGGGRH